MENNQLISLTLPKLNQLSISFLEQKEIIAELNNQYAFFKKTPPENYELYSIIVDNICLLSSQHIHLIDQIIDKSSKILDESAIVNREKVLINKAFEKQSCPKPNPSPRFRMTSLYINGELIIN